MSGAKPAVPAKDVAHLVVKLVDKSGNPVDAWVEVWSYADDRTVKGVLERKGLPLTSGTGAEKKSGWTIWVRDRAPGTTVEANDKRRVLAHREVVAKSGKVEEVLVIELPRTTVTGTLLYLRTWDHYKYSSKPVESVKEPVPGLRLELWGRPFGVPEAIRLGETTTADDGAFTLQAFLPPLVQAFFKLVFEHEKAVRFVGNLYEYTHKTDWETKKVTPRIRPVFNAYTHDPDYDPDVTKDKGVKIADGETVTANVDLLLTSLIGKPVVELGKVLVKPTRVLRLCAAYHTLVVCWQRTTELMNKTYTPGQCKVVYPHHAAAMAQAPTNTEPARVILSDDSLHAHCMIAHEYGHWLAYQVAEPPIAAGYDYESPKYPDYFLVDGNRQGHTGDGRTYPCSAFQEAYASFIGCAIRKNPVHHQYWVGATNLETDPKNPKGAPIKVIYAPNPLHYDARSPGKNKLGGNNEQSVLYALWAAFASTEGDQSSVLVDPFMRFWTVFANKGKGWRVDDIGDFLIQLRQAKSIPQQHADKLATALKAAGGAYVWRCDPRGGWTAQASGFDLGACKFSKLDEVWGAVAKQATFEDWKEEFFNCNTSEVLRALAKPKASHPLEAGSTTVAPKVKTGGKYTVPTALDVDKA